MPALRKVLVVIGTTGAGKTKLSVDLAKAVNGEIVNSDAMQMYRGLDIATAKITEQEKQGIPHHLFDVVDPTSCCDVLEFKRLALHTINNILDRGKVPIIVGGTMYYTQAILWKSQLLDDVPVVYSSTEHPEHLGPQTPEALYNRLLAVDPVMASRLHVNNVRKIQRSLQVFEQTGVPHSELLAQQEKEQHNIEKYFDACAFWVQASKPVLDERLSKRVETMLNAGLVDEIRSLRALVKNSPPRQTMRIEEESISVGILQAIGYKEFQPYFDALESSDGTDDLTILETLNECVVQLKIATRQYARRQLSWIRNKFVTRNIPVYQIDSTDLAKWEEFAAQRAFAIARVFLKNGEMTVFRSVQEQHPEVAQAASLEDKFQRNTCTVCVGREIMGKKQWAEHLRSKGHKYHLKRVEIITKQAESPLLNNCRQGNYESTYQSEPVATLNN
ncbi:putative P-loop containing nucleoside triphosphate hydrolase, dimethylallyltransferase [Plasmopara halstedii]